MKTLYGKDGTPINLLQNVDIESYNGGSCNWIKLPDGTAIIYGWETFNGVNINKEWGSVFYEVLTPNLKSYPFKFIGSPTVIYTSGVSNVMSASMYGYSADTLPKIEITSPKIINNLNDLYIYYIVIGKWK